MRAMTMVGICLLAGVIRSVPFVAKTDESIHPIMRGKFGRRMTLLARPQMLGSAPRVIVDECRAILDEEIFPQLLAALPWLDGSFKVGED